MKICPHCGTRADHEATDPGLFNSIFKCNNCTKEFETDTNFYKGVKAAGSIALLVGAAIGIIDHESGGGNRN